MKHDSGHGHPQILMLDKGLKLAEKWVAGMSNCEEDSKEVAPVSRKSRLGLGAIATPHNGLDLDDPVARKLYAKINYTKKKNSISDEPSSAIPKEESDEDDEHESRNKAFVKKRAATQPNLSQSKKKKK